MASEAQKTTKILVIFDDTLVKKCRKKILGSYKWFDHTIGRIVQGICTVNVAVVLNDQLLFITPWIQWKRDKTNSARSTMKKDQDAKILAAIAMI